MRRCHSVNELRGVLRFGMPSDPPEKAKPDDEPSAHEKDSEGEDKDALQPSPEKIPESEGNLRRRADWFQKRTGGTG